MAAVGYLVRTPPGTSHAFVPDAAFDGRWIRTDPCVLFVDCPTTKCRAKVGRACNSWSTGIGNSHAHYARRDAWRQLKRMRERLHGRKVEHVRTSIVIEYANVVRIP